MVLFPMTLSDLAKYSMTRNIEQLLCDRRMNILLFLCDRPSHRLFNPGNKGTLYRYKY